MAHVSCNLFKKQLTDYAPSIPVSSGNVSVPKDSKMSAVFTSHRSSAPDLQIPCLPKVAPSGLQQAENAESEAATEKFREDRRMRGCKDGE